MVAQVVRVYVKTPAELWALALGRQGDVPPDLAKYLALGTASTDPRDIRRWSALALGHEHYLATKSSEEARKLAIHTALTMLIIAEISMQEYGGECEMCTEGILHRLALSYMYAIARTHGLRPVVQEGEHKGLKYLVVAASETALPEVVKAVAELIEEACRRARLCR